jgi:hypothetical protein
MAKVTPTSSGFSGNPRNILMRLEHLINNGQWQEYNKKLDNLAKKYSDNPEVIKMVKELRIKNTKDFRLKHIKGGN